MGKAKHFPPAAQEWYNSIYTYNNNYTKALPVLNKNLMNLLNSYFNMFIKHKVLKTKFIANRYRRLSSKKIFIGKGELKHTNSKVIITFYVYNTEKMSLKREYKKLYRSLYFPTIKYTKTDRMGKKLISYKEDILKRYVSIDKQGNIIRDNEGKLNITYNRPYTLKEFLESPNYYKTYYSQRSHLKLISYYDIYYSIIASLINKLTTYLEIIIKYYEYLTKLVKIKVLNNDEKYLIFTNKASNFYAYEYPKSDIYMNIAENRYKNKLYRLRYLLKFNDVKFEKSFIQRLRRLVEKLYDKEIEFNIVNLNKMHLNSDIFTQAIVLKLKNRKNRLLRVLRSSLSNVKLPDVNRISESYSKSDKDEFLVNKIRNLYVKNMFDKDITKTDSLNKLLLNLFPSADSLEINIEKRSSSIKHSISLNNYIFRYLKHFKLAGIRVEAKGRLTRRFTASRSVFKLLWKGGLRNVDSSFKGLSTVMLRGDVKSNVEYSNLNSKNRIGAFGIKGWVSNK